MTAAAGIILVESIHISTSLVRFKSIESSVRFDHGSATIQSGAETVERYRAWSGRTDRVLATTDLDAPPRWWPPADLFPFPPFGTARQGVFRLLVETATHAGHLDIVRELIDGHQHLVVE